MAQLGDWILGEPIGHGARAVVHRGHHRLHPDRHVAIKRVRLDVAVAPDDLATVAREAEILRSLSHPSILEVVDVVADGDGVALVMPLALGSLRARIDSSGALPWSDVADIGARIAAALAAAHGVGIVHRDVTPGNVLFGHDLDVQLADFGTGLLGDATRIVGTPGYIAPEVAAGDQPTPQADVHALGVVLFEALSGHLPWAGATPDAIMRDADRGLHVPLAELAPAAPANLAAIIEQAMHRDPARRPRNAQLLYGALHQAGLAAGGSEPAGDNDAAGGSDPAGGNDAAGPSDPRGVQIPPPTRATSAPNAGASGPGVGATSSAPGAGTTLPDAAATAPGAGSRLADAAEASSGPTVPGGSQPAPAPPTTDFGPRPSAPIEFDEPSRPWWLWAVVAAVVVVPLAVAAWAVVNRPDTTPIGAGSAPSATPASTPAGPVATTPPAVPTDPPTSEHTPTPTSTHPSTPAPTPNPDADDPRSWPRRRPAPRCEDVRAPRDNEQLVDVDGRGCSLPVGTDMVGQDFVITLPDAAGDIAGTHAFRDREPLSVVFGDWDGDGSETPAMIWDVQGQAMGYARWSRNQDDNVEATPIGDPIGSGAPMVVIGPNGADTVIADDGV